MKSFMTFTFVLAALALPGVALGQCYGPAYYQPTYYPPVVQQVVQVVKEVAFVAQPVFVPLYSTGYVPPVAVSPAVSPVNQPAPQAQRQGVGSDDKLDRVITLLTAQSADLKSLSGRVDALEGRRAAAQQAPEPPPPPARTDPRVAGLAVLKNRCAVCHTEGRLFVKDAGAGARQASLVIFKADGSVAKLRAEDRIDIAKRMRSQTMPLDPQTLRPHGLTNDEYADAQDYLDTMK